nr:PREDICTED: uncharacterized protein LOC105672905 [Linepithema humile]XP_012223597.1 PREDICTED: uncharacterized protein LOC105672905 [Linepithema humile]
MEDNEMTYDETFEEIDQSIIKKSPKIEDYIETENLKIHPVVMKEEYRPPKRGRGRPRKKRLDVKTQSSTTSKVNYSTVDSELGLKKVRYRPIRPKPFPPGASLLRHKMFGTPLMLNMSTLTSNRVIVTVPSKDKTQNITLNDLSKTTVDNNDRSTISKESKTNEKAIENSNIKINTEKGLRKAKTVSHLPCKSSIELFFESMAQTVLNLPTEVQADIKMKICKLVTMAEMKYCGSHVKSKTD